VAQACRSVLREANLAPGSIDDVVMVGGSTRIPHAQKIAREIFQAETLDRSANPDECVALGAAILGGVLQGDLHNVHLMDVTANGFGVADAQGRMQTIVPRNTPIPAVVKQVFSTPSDHQRNVPIQVLEGEKTYADDNRPLGLFQLTGIRKAPRGVPRIEVAFAIDANGILDVSATDLDSGKSQHIVVTGSYGLDEDEIETLREESESREQLAEEKHQTVELKNHAEQVHHDVSQWLEHNASVLPPKQLAKLQGVLAKLSPAIKTKDTRTIRKCLKSIDAHWREYRIAG
ncbi:MAG: Hsp70 family protein, partial [Planctomycetota bacterium]